MDDDKDLSWKKPDWATTGPKLRSTGKGDDLKSGGNLAKAITNLPHQKEEDLEFKKPEWTGEAAAKEGQRIQGDLAKPITSAPHTQADGSLQWEKPDWTKNAPIKTSDKGAALKEGKEIARPIGGIKPVDD